MWKVKWRSRITEASGLMPQEYKTREQAQAKADTANALFPTIDHWVVEKRKRKNYRIVSENDKQ